MRDKTHSVDHPDTQPFPLPPFIMDKTPAHPKLSQAEQVPATPRKRQIDSDSNDEPAAKRTRLTRKNLALFDKMGKKTSDPTDDSKSTKTTSTTTSGFADKAYKEWNPPPTSLQTSHEPRRHSQATRCTPRHGVASGVRVRGLC